MALPRKVTVIGAGDIGCGWAALCVAAGWPVTLFDASAQGLERGAADVPQRARALVEQQRANQGIVERGLLEFVQARSLLQAVKDADWVIEAIPEDLMAKQRLFDSIEQVAGHEALLTSSSSGINLDNPADEGISLEESGASDFDLSLEPEDTPKPQKSRPVEDSDSEFEMKVETPKPSKKKKKPVEEPSEFDFAINLATAKALGIAIPPALTLQATRIIEE